MSKSEELSFRKPGHTTLLLFSGLSCHPSWLIVCYDHPKALPTFLLHLVQGLSSLVKALLLFYSKHAHVSLAWEGRGHVLSTVMGDEPQASLMLHKCFTQTPLTKSFTVLSLTVLCAWQVCQSWNYEDSESHGLLYVSENTEGIIKYLVS